MKNIVKTKKKAYTVDWESLGLFLATTFMLGALSGAIMIYAIMRAIVA